MRAPRYESPSLFPSIRANVTAYLWIRLMQQFPVMAQIVKMIFPYSEKTFFIGFEMGDIVSVYSSGKFGV
jgi:hypothetical protein